MMEGLDNHELKRMLSHVQKENLILRTEIEALKGNMRENTVVDSMNDMKEAYSELAQENVLLEERIQKYESDPSRRRVPILEKSVKNYQKLIDILQKRAAKMMIASELIEASLSSGADDDGDITINEMYLDAVFSVQHVANSYFEELTDHTIPSLRKCLEGECSECNKCSTFLEGSFT